MKRTEKKKIAVLFGGASTEHEVSLQSAYSVLTHMDREKYEPVAIGITRQGKWLLYTGALEKIEQGTWEEEPCDTVAASPDRQLHGLYVLGETGVRTLRIDGAFPVLHGKNGEDGTVQGVFELAGIPVIGCGVLCSALCMDKDMTHRLAAASGVKVPASHLFTRADAARENGAAVKSRGRELGYPLFVKPLRAGSSFGITKVMQEEDLEQAVAEAFRHDSYVLLEKMIDGFEVGCAVLGDEELTVGEVDEIELSQGFFDYTEKYTLKTSDIHVPARIASQKAQEIKQTAQVIYRTLGCSGFARVDMFLTPAGDIYLNEVNTIPGFTTHSRYPGMMREIGISFEEIVDRLIGSALGEEK